MGEEVSSFERSLPDGFLETCDSELTVCEIYHDLCAYAPCDCKPLERNLNMSLKELGGKRSYKTDFEIYDQRAADHQNIVFDVCVGV